MIVKNGSYISDGAGGFLKAEGYRAILADVLFRLTCRRGAVPLLPDLGSRFFTLCREKPSARPMAARQYAAEALSGTGVTVRDCAVTEHSDGTLQVTVLLTVEGTDTTLEVTV